MDVVIFKKFFVLKDVIDKLSALVQIIAWHGTGDLRLSEPMMAYFTYAYIYHTASLSWNMKVWLCIQHQWTRPSWASYQIHKIAGAHARRMPGTFSPSAQVSDPGMHHGTCVTHVPWCMPGSLTNGFLWNRRRGKTFPAFPAHAQPAIFHIW